MTYATLEQLTERYGEGLLVQITDRGEVPTGVVDIEAVNRALANADAYINGYMGRYSLPFAAVPDPLPDLAQAIAIYRLHRFKPDPKIEDEYKDAKQALRDIASGLVKLSAEGAEPGGAPGSGVRMTDRERPFTAQNLKGFI